MPNPQTAWLVVNSASGSFDLSAPAEMIALLGNAGWTVARVVDLQDGVAPSRRDLEAGRVSLLVLFTGDGSVSRQVADLEGWDGDVLVLPGGTSNLLARALHGDAAPGEIVGMLGRGDLRRSPRSGIGWREGIGLIEVLAGPGAQWSDVREDLRDGALVQAAANALDAARESVAGPKVELVVPQGAQAEGYSGVRLAPAQGGLEVAGYYANGLGDYLRQGLALARRDFREGPHDELGCHAQVHCRSSDGSPIALMVDGEKYEGRAEEHFRLAPLPVAFLASPHGR